MPDSRQPNQASAAPGERPAGDVTVSVVVLNFNGLAYLPECLASLEGQTFRDFEVVVADNGSTDGSAAWLRAHAAAHTLLLLERNLGFAAGNNAALDHARGRLIVFLNNDTRVDPDWLAHLVAAAGEHPEAGMFGSQIRSYDKPEILDTVGITVYRDGMSRGLGRLQPAALYDEPLEIFAPSGCAAMYRREVLDAVGPFDPAFFAYCEDMDLGMRARLAGWTCRYVPAARVYHHYSGTTGKYSPLKAFLVERNHLWLLIKLFPLRMIAASPWYTLKRYALQAYGVFSGKGAAGRFASEFPAYKLVGILIRAYWETLLALPRLLRERRSARGLVRVPRREILGWFDRFGITATELAMRD